MKVEDFITLRCDTSSWVGKTLENVINYDSESTCVDIVKTVGFSKRLHKYIPYVFDKYEVQTVGFKSGSDRVIVYGLYDKDKNKVLEIIEKETSLDLIHKDIHRKFYSIKTLIKALQEYYNVSEEEVQEHYKKVIAPILKKNK